MSGTYPRLERGPSTYEVSVAVTGGQLVEPDTGGKVKPAGAASDKVLGVALNDAQPDGSAPTNPINTAWPRPRTAVARGVEVKLTYSAAAVFGQLLVSAANGQVAPLGATAAATDARQIIGRCTEPNGVSGAGVVARARVF